MYIMIRSHQASLLRRLFSTPKDKQICPHFKVFDKTKIVPTRCLNEKYRHNCACKRRRKDIDKITKLSRDDDMVTCLFYKKNN
jgi:hypothetical protein